MPWEQSRPTRRQRVARAAGALAKPVLLLLGVGVIGGGLVALVYYAPNLLVNDHGLSANQRETARGSVRLAVVQAAAALAILAGLFFTARSWALARSGQITDRFSKAIGQLGDESIDVRIGALYALEQISHDAKPYRRVVADVLQRFVAGRCDKTEGMSSPEDADGETSSDVQVALEIIARGKVRHDWRRVSLYGLDVPGLVLDGAELPRLNAYYARLDRAELVEANFGQGGFGWASLRNAFLSRSNLRQADFFCACLEGSYLPGVDAREANFARAKLSRADFSYRRNPDGKVVRDGARLDGARFDDAEMQGTDLKGVDLSKALGLTQEQIDSALIDENTVLPAGIARPSAVISQADGPAA